MCKPLMCHPGLHTMTLLSFPTSKLHRQSILALFPPELQIECRTFCQSTVFSASLNDKQCARANAMHRYSWAIARMNPDLVTFISRTEETATGGRGESRVFALS